MSALMNDDNWVSKQAIIERLNECVNLIRSNSKRLEIKSTLTNLNPGGEVLPAGFQAGHPNSNDVVDNDKINGILQVLTKIFSKIRKVKVNTYYDGKLKSSETTDKPIINLTVDSPDLIYGRVGGIGENIVVDNQDIEKRLNEIYQIWISLPPIEQTIDVQTCKSCRDNPDVYHSHGGTGSGSCKSGSCKSGIGNCRGNAHGGRSGCNCKSCRGGSASCRGNAHGGRSGCNCKSCRGGRSGGSGGKGGKK